MSIKKFDMTVNPISDMTIYDNIRAIMRKKKLCIEDCADAVGVDSQVFEEWLDGRLQMPLSYLVPLAEYLDTSLVYLLVPDGKAETDCFVFDRRPMLRLREYTRLGIEIRDDKALRDMCVGENRVCIENPALDLVFDTLAMRNCEANTNRAKNLEKMSDEEYAYLSKIMIDISDEVYSDDDFIELDPSDVYYKLVAEDHSFKEKLDFLHKQALFSYVNAFKHCYTTPESDGSWYDILQYFGWCPDDVFYDATDDEIVVEKRYPDAFDEEIEIEAEEGGIEL